MKEPGRYSRQKKLVHGKAKYSVWHIQYSRNHTDLSLAETFGVLEKDEGSDRRSSAVTTDRTGH